MRAQPEGRFLNHPVARTVVRPLLCLNSFWDFLQNWHGCIDLYASALCLPVRARLRRHADAAQTLIQTGTAALVLDTLALDRTERRDTLEELASCARLILLLLARARDVASTTTWRILATWMETTGRSLAGHS